MSTNIFLEIGKFASNQCEMLAIDWAFVSYNDVFSFPDGLVSEQQSRMWYEEMWDAVFNHMSLHSPVSTYRDFIVI